MTLEDRTRHYKEFKLGKQRVMVATSAFGLGVDIDDIDEVIVFGDQSWSGLLDEVGGMQHVFVLFILLLIPWI
jgi:hypothetical protein